MDIRDNNCNCDNRRPMPPPPPPRPMPPPRPPFPPNDMEQTTVGRILDVNRRDRQFTLMPDRGPDNMIRFNLSRNARITDPFGRPVDFSFLVPGLRVSVMHADFMTNSIPPQTTAYEVRILR